MLLSSALSLAVSCCETFTALVLELANGLGTGAIIEVSTCFIVLRCCIGGGKKSSTGKVAISGSTSKAFGPKPVVNLIPGWSWIGLASESELDVIIVYSPEWELASIIIYVSTVLDHG